MPTIVNNMNIESMLGWKRWAYVLLALVTVYMLYHGASAGNTYRNNLSHQGDSRESTQTGGGSVPGDAKSHPSHETYQHERPDPIRNLDGEFVDAMTMEQCHNHFPDQYKDIEERIAYWKKRRHIISENDIDISWRSAGTNNPGGAMRILVHDNRLRVTESIDIFAHPGYHERGMSMLGLLQQAMSSAVAAGEQLPTVEIALILDDIANPPTADGTHSFWAFAAKEEDETHERRWLMPSYNLLQGSPAGSFMDARRLAVQYDAPFADKIQKVVWRGNPNLNAFVRRPLLELTGDKIWADVKPVVPFDPSTNVGRLTSDEFCQYAMTVHTEGISYSGRLNTLLNCDSLIIAHDLEWYTYWQHLLQDSGPHQNYVSVNRTWDDLEEKVKHFLDHPDEADTIIANSIATFRGKYLTQAAQSCYIRALIRGYASVTFKPTLYQPETADGIKRLRGMPYESVMNFPIDFDETTLGYIDTADPLGTTKRPEAGGTA